MSVDWRLGLSPDVTGNAFGAFMQGQQAQEADKAKNAMTAYVTNPNPENLNALAPYQPQLVLQQKQAEQEKAAKAAEAKLIGDALTGNPEARKQLAYTNSEMYLKLDDRQKKAVDGMMDNIGQTAFKILQLPEDQQNAALDQAIAGFKANGIDTSSFVRTGNAKNDLMVALAVSGQLDKYEKFAQPNYVPVGEGGLAGFQFGQPIQQGGQPQNFGPQQQVARPADKAAYDALPPGTQYVAPDGSVRTKGGASGNAGGPFRPVGVNQSGVTSTYRTPKHNAEVGGVKNSYHTRRGVNGEPLAVDSVPPAGMSMADYAAKLRRLNPNYDVINEGDHVHIEPKG